MLFLNEKNFLGEFDYPVQKSKVGKQCTFYKKDLDKIFRIIHKYQTSFGNDCKLEFDFFTKIHDYLELEKFYQIWGTLKTNYQTIKNYCNRYNLYHNFITRYKSFGDNSTAKIATNPDTSISLFHFYGNYLYVYSRKCGMSCEFLRDLCQIQIMCDYLDIDNFQWAIVVPYVVKSNGDKHQQFYKNAKTILQDMPEYDDE